MRFGRISADRDDGTDSAMVPATGFARAGGQSLAVRLIFAVARAGDEPYALPIG